ncbi:MAG: archaellin/type IV pilin N-terminal domain-containing protein [Nitrososphaerota archaeon]
MNRKNKGISPVVATVIIVAIAIALAIAVALWASGLVGIFTRFEEVKVISAYADLTSGTFTVTLDLKNTGSADATIDNVVINGKPYSSWTGISVEVGGSPFDPNTGFTLKSGETATMILSFSAGQGGPGFKSGQTLDIKIHTAAGHDYAKAVVLP